MSVHDILGTSRFTDIDSLLNNFHSAAANAELDKYFSCFSNQGIARFLGTDATENWTMEEFYGFCQPYFGRTGGGWTFIPKGERKVSLFPQPPSLEEFSTYVPQFAVFDELLESKSFVATSRGSGTLIFDSSINCWFIASYHLSFPIPNEIAREFTSKIAKFEKTQEEEKKKTAKEISLQEAEEVAKKHEEELLKELEIERQEKKGKGGTKKKKNEKK